MQNASQNKQASHAGTGKLNVPVAVRLLLPLVCLLFSACTTVQVATDQLAEKALGAIGVKLENPNQPRPAKTLNLRLEASHDLNAGEDGQGLSTIFRIYKLKDQNAFMSSPYSVFGSAEKEKAAFGSDLVEVREVVLSPGQTLDLKEKITNETAFLGTVALYRVPSPHRWRFVFASADSEKKGIILGLHACAMTATATPPVGMTLNESTLLSSARCRRSS